VGVNEAGQQRGVAQVDYFRPGRERCAGADGGDFFAGHHHQAR